MDAAPTKEPLLEQAGKEIPVCHAARIFVRYHLRPKVPAGGLRLRW